MEKVISAKIDRRYKKVDNYRHRIYEKAFVEGFNFVEIINSYKKVPDVFRYVADVLIYWLHKGIEADDAKTVVYVVKDLDYNDKTLDIFIRNKDYTVHNNRRVQDNYLAVRT